VILHDSYDHGRGDILCNASESFLSKLSPCRRTLTFQKFPANVMKLKIIVVMMTP
jgi:hypothetical protein